MTYLLSTSLKGNYSLKYFKIGCKSENKRFIINSLVVVSYICFKRVLKENFEFCASLSDTFGMHDDIFILPCQEKLRSLKYFCTLQ